MYKIFFFLTFSFLFLSKGIGQNVKNVDSKTFFSLIESGNGIILDVRTQGEYSRGHIKGSTLISTNDPNFVSKTSLLQKDKSIYIYCYTGARSSAVGRYLSQKGYTKLYNLTSGIIEWQRSGYSLVQSKKTIASTSVVYTASGFNEILLKNQFVFVDFHAKWCAPCKKMLPIIDQVEKDYSQVLIKKVDVEANKELKNQYNVSAIPGFLLFKNGKTVWSHTGMISYEDLKQVLEYQLNK